MDNSLTCQRIASWTTAVARSIPVLILLLATACSNSAIDLAVGSSGSGSEGSVQETSTTPPQSGTEVVTLGAGCFWCVEAVLQQVEGVREVRSGYMGGEIPDPTYEQVCTGQTGHAEVVQVVFDPSVISFAAVMEWFWQLHDPTTLNRQGADVGTQYRSAVFYHSPEQAEAARVSMRAAQANFAAPIVTEITAASTFYEAEPYHQDYYFANRSQGYCRAVIAPKLDKLGLPK